MKTFRVKVTEKILLTQIFEVEAETEQDAIELYSEELAGSIEPVEEWTSELKKDDVEDVVIE